MPLIFLYSFNIHILATNKIIVKKSNNFFKIQKINGLYIYMYVCMYVCMYLLAHWFFALLKTCLFFFLQLFYYFIC